MERGSTIEDEFSKLHPSFHTDTRIGIIGAGPSGLSAAFALCKLGYTNITILEKHHSVGGMCESVDIEGRIYDLGGQVLAANSAPTIFHLAKEIEAETEELDAHKFAIIDSSTGKFDDTKVIDDYLSIISLTLKLQDEAKATGRIGVHAVSDSASELTPSFLKANGLKSVPKSIAYGFTASGYGYVEDMPYAYVHEFTRTSMAGKIRRFKGGYTSVWDKISKRIPAQVHCNTQVLAVKRNANNITIRTQIVDGERKDMEFDKLIISGSFPLNSGKTYRSPLKKTEETVNEVMDLSNLEKDLFSKVETIDYYTTVLKIDGLEHIPVGFYYFEEFMDDPKTIGNPVAMQRFYSDTNIFLFWSYGNSVNIMGEKVIRLAVDAVTRIGGKVEKVTLQRRFKYFPHVRSREMKDGFYDKLEHQLQGQNNTFYVGGLMAFELTERNSSYALSLVMKHFASDNPEPSFPYVKRLITMKSDNHSWIPKQLDEALGVEFPDISSIDGYLRHWATHECIANKTLYTWTNDKGEAINQRTYKELDANASYIAHSLLTNNKPNIKSGDRVLLVYVPGLEFVDAFFGCLRARIIPVPAIPPDPSQKGEQSLIHIENIAKRTKAVAILSTFGYHVYVKANSAKNKIMRVGKRKNSACWPDLPWLHTDSWIKNSKVGNISYDDVKILVNRSQVLPKDLCFLQFTSGSTGDAKGVMITHGGLIHNVKLMHKVYKSTSKTVLVSWLPQYHDMGLIGGFLTSLVSGGTAILFSPITFIKNPLLWLQTMSQFQATHSAGPNFAFELLIRRLVSKKEKILKLDLSSMVFLMVAAEPVRSKTLKRFIELTRTFGLSQEVMAPGYGMAENSVYISSAYGHGEPIFEDWQGRICCGYVSPNDPDVDIRIVDPETGEEHIECGKEGEVWISSPSAGVGYWAMEELSQKTFQNELQGHAGKMYLRSGDLGRIIDRKLFITGRIKDLIIIGGRNIYSSDIEKTVESSSDFIRPGCCAVIGVPEQILLAKGIMIPENSDQLGLVVIAEVRGNKSLVEEVVEHIQTLVAEEHGITIASIVLIKERSICKTTSGKIKRFECLKQFTDGKLQVIQLQHGKKPSLIQSTTSKAKDSISIISKKEIIQFLKKLISDQTGIPTASISITESLSNYGTDSIGVVRAAQKLSAFLGIPVGAIDIFTATCIDDLADFAEDLVRKSCPQSPSFPSDFPDNKTSSMKLSVQVSSSRRLGVWLFHLIALIYISFLLMIPMSLSISTFTTLISEISRLMDITPWFGYLISLTCAPLAWMFCIGSSCMTIALFGNSFLQPNYGLNPDVSIWSIEFVKWWALYKAQEVSTRVYAVHLKGTLFAKLWFEMLGAKIGSSVLLDTIDITDPYLVTIGDGTVIAEGALIQSHEVKNGVLSFQPIRIGENSCVGPYTVIQKGSILADGVELPALQTCKGGQHEFKMSKTPKDQQGPVLQDIKSGCHKKHEPFYHIIGIYMVGFLSCLSAAIGYTIYLWLLQKPQSLQHFSFLCLCASVHWLPFNVIAYIIMFRDVPTSPLSFSINIAIAYLAHGMILTFLTSILLRILSKVKHRNLLVMWFCHRLTTSCHLKFAKFLSGTEAFCVYLRLLGARIGHHCSIRAINPISDPELVSIGDGVHLGDFSRIVPGFYNSKGYVYGHVTVQENSVVGSQGLVLPGSVIEANVILGALSVAPINSVLRTGGVFVGSQTPIMVKNITHTLDDRIEEMDIKYKKVLGNLAANFSAATLKVKARYFHRIGATGKGTLRLYKNVPGIPEHKIFSSGKSYPIIVRHSNCLSSDDDARIDPRGAAIRILSDEHDTSTALLDLTLKTGKSFHARTIGDFATWLICGAEAREEQVKNAPHVKDAMWDSLRKANSYAELHYYSNICRLFRFEDGKEMYVKFKLRPFDKEINEDSGKVEPTSILPPETGAIPRDENDTRPLLFLNDDFQRRVNSPEKIQYVLQLQFRPVPNDETVREAALDCTRPWDEKEYPYVEVGEITIEQVLTNDESRKLEFNPFLRCHEVDVIRATSCSQSASMDHGRSVVYSICQHLRNNKPLPEAWRSFLDHSDVKVDLNGCPMAVLMEKEDVQKVTLARPWYQNLWMMFAQPFLQIVVPYFLMGLTIFTPLNVTIYLKEQNSLQLHWLLPFFWFSSGILAGLVCVLAKWVLVGKKKEGETVMIWSIGIYMDTIWQAIRTLVGEYFMETSSGSVVFGLWMNLMGSDIVWDQGAYVDSMGAVLNPEMVSIERYGSVGREALLFGHIYEGEGGKVKFGKIRIKEAGFIGSRAVAMPRVTVEKEGSLAALSLAMKGEIIK
ncbi:Acyl carrier protein-like protein [Cynara cardunculus var. scolymus]|uniref:Acyl carrier protein-like protein n=1 Tax=Cynara cardunculus var. scolymus TaxID=59895 RepID=A0A118JU17_CYNCS|nr:Acyl carrier protein-like protein [Cynara cardunculus var. scolymus]